MTKFLGRAIGIWSAVGIFAGAATIVSCGSKPVTFAATSKGAGADAGGNSEGDGGGVRDKSHIVDTFLLPSLEQSEDQFSVPTQPFQVASFEQIFGAPITNTTTILDKNAPNRNITITGPLLSRQTHSVTHVGKPVDIFIVLDDTETFSGAAQTRAKNLVNKLVANLNGMDWKIFMSGLPGGADDAVVITPNTDVSGKMSEIFKGPSMGDEPSFRGIANLAERYSGQDRDNAVHAYFVITDAPNCKDMNNTDSGACNRALGQKDNHRYLFDRTNAILPQHMQHMSIFGAYYRQTNGPICSSFDQVEVPSGGEALTLNSQFADLSLFWEQFLFSGRSSPSYVGDICAGSENLSFVDSFTNDIKDLAARRFVLANQFDVFSADPGFNFAIKNVSPSDYRTVDNRMVIVNSGTHAGETLTADGNQTNNYRNLVFSDVFDAPARDGTVFVSGIGMSRIACKSGNDFAGYQCRHSGRDLYFKDYSQLPPLGAASPALSSALTVEYERDVIITNKIVVNSAQDIIMPDKIEFAASGAAPARTLSVSGKTITYTFASVLPPGVYTVRYFDNSYKATTKSLVAAADPTKAGPVCFLPQQKAAPSGDKIVLDSGSGLPCTLMNGNLSIRLDALVPVNLATGKRDFKVAYLASTSDQSDFDLTSLPSNGALVVKRFAVGSAQGVQLAASEFKLTNTRIHLFNPLKPGEKITVSYQFLPQLGDGCFLLSRRLLASKAFEVSAGKPDGESKLGKELFIITEPTNDSTRLCVKKDLLDYGHRVQISYTADLKGE